MHGHTYIKYIFVFYSMCLILNIFRFLLLGRVYRVCSYKDMLKVTILTQQSTGAVCLPVTGERWRRLRVVQDKRHGSTS